MDWLDYEDSGEWSVGADGAGVSLAKIETELASPSPGSWIGSPQMGGTPGADNAASMRPLATLVPIDAEWRYEATGTDPGPGWPAVAYDDTAWRLARGVFYRVDDEAPITWVGEGNRSAPQDFGLSPSTGFAQGAVIGEIGGYIERSPAAWYGDGDIDVLDLATDDLTAGVTWRQEGLGNATFGYVQADTYGTASDPDGLYWQIDDLNLYVAARSGDFLAEAQVATLVANRQARITMEWVAATRTWTVALDGGPSQSITIPESAIGVPLDRFGVFSLGRSSGAGVGFWADDIEYTIRSPGLSQRVETFGLAGPPAGARTELPPGPATYYFRAAFEADAVLAAGETWLQPVVSDGAVVYLNGEEIFRYNMPTGAAVASTPASGDIDPFTVPPPVILPPGVLVAGTNVLSAEVHRSGTDDGRVAFAAALVAPARSVGGPPPVLINEMPAATDTGFWLELFNAGLSPVELGGYVLVTGNGDESVLAPETLPAGGYLVLEGATLGLDVATGERLFLFTPAREQLVDAAVATDAPRARLADPPHVWRAPHEASPGATNAHRLNGQVVINEIMYHRPPPTAEGSEPGAPALEDASLEAWIELYNRGAAVVDLTGWRIENGIEFAFAPGTALAPGEHLIVAKDEAFLRTLYPSLRVAGEFERNLSGSSDLIRLVDADGNPADDVRYHDRGHWPVLADGGGSSLELRDPRADNAGPAAWAPSAQSGSSRWRSYVYRATAVAIVSGLPNASDDFWWMGLLDGPGELLLDDVSVILDPDGAATELIANGTFDGGSTEGWRFNGTHRHATVVRDGDDPDNWVLRLAATGPTEPEFNHILAELVTDAFDGAEYEVSFRARWLAGYRQLHTSLRYGRLARTTLLELPPRLGTPGAPNWQRVDNLGPTFSALGHFPVVPAVGQPAAVSTRADDPDGVASATLWWSANESDWRPAAMQRQPDGTYVASVPGQTAGTIVQFFVEALDGLGESGFAPPAGAESRALYVVDDGQAPDGPVHALRTIMLPSEADYLYGPGRRSNERLGSTVVWKERQTFYDVGVRLRGSLGSGRGNETVGQSLAFQPDRPFRGTHRTVSLDRDARAAATLQEILIQHIIARAGDMPAMYNDIVHAIASDPTHTSRAILRMAGQGDDFLDSQYENGSDGTLFESEVIRKGGVIYVDFMDLGDGKEAYRWIFTIQNNRRRDDYRGLIALAKTLGLPAGPELETRAAEVMDVSQWMRVFAVQALGAVADTYLQDGNHNLRVYQRPSDGRMLAFPWDWDGAFAESPLPWGEGNLTRVIERPAYTRLYYWHMYDVLESTFNVEYLSRWIDHYGALAGEDFADVLAFIDERSAQARALLPPRVPFAVTASTASPADGTALVEGTAWIDVAEIRASDAPLDVTWTATDTWQATVPLPAGPDGLRLTAIGHRGETVPVGAPLPAP